MPFAEFDEKRGYVIASFSDIAPTTRLTFSINIFVPKLPCMKCAPHAKK